MESRMLDEALIIICGGRNQSVVVINGVPKIAKLVLVHYRKGIQKITKMDMTAVKDRRKRVANDSWLTESLKEAKEHVRQWPSWKRKLVDCLKANEDNYVPKGPQ
jgi:hypothetical protein